MAAGAAMPGKPVGARGPGACALRSTPDAAVCLLLQTPILIPLARLMRQQLGLLRQILEEQRRVRTISPQACSWPLHILLLHVPRAQQHIPRSGTIALRCAAEHACSCRRLSARGAGKRRSFVAGRRTSTKART